MDEGQPMRVLDLFSGIGGFSLGLERAGMQTIAFCETDNACQKVLQKHWPDVPIFNDVKELTHNDLQEPIDVICGGFPCQDISFAGKGAGLEGERSGLWWEFHRLIKEIKPTYVIAENVSALRSRGLDEILRSLAEIGYDAEWHCIPASAVGAPHRRDRIWIIAYPQCKGLQGLVYKGSGLCKPEEKTRAEFGDRSLSCGVQWPRLSEYLRMGNGLSRGSHRVKQLGNAVVPQIPELIGRAIMEIK
jgi:DNA (cytosine-5)-methyltransferase 1